MWLPKNERILLQHYCIIIGGPDKECFFRLTLLEECLKPTIKPIVAHGTYEGVEEYKKYSEKHSGLGPPINDLTCRIRMANKALAARQLIILNEKQPDEDGSIKIQLTLKGYDLGRKYNSWWTRSGLWFAEYKDHWFWLIVSFLGGIIGALIVNWLSKV